MLLEFIPDRRVVGEQWNHSEQRLNLFADSGDILLFLDQDGVKIFHNLGSGNSQLTPRIWDLRSVETEEFEKNFAASSELRK
jgi:hypothetical protein